MSTTTDAAPTLDLMVEAIREATESELRQRLRSRPGLPESLAAAARYAVLGGGKRIRPVVCMLSAHTLGGQPAF